MSYVALAWAWAQKVGDPESKLLLIKLADQANDDGVCWPSRGSLARDCEVSESTIKRRVGVLADRGFLEVQQRRRANGSLTSNLYLLQLHRGPAVTRGTVDQSSDPIGTISFSPQENGIGRPRNEIWDALELLFGSAETDTSKTKRGKVARSLARAGATGAEIARRAARWPDLFDDATLTELALEKHWGQLDPAVPIQRRPPRRYGRGLSTAEILAKADGMKEEEDAAKRSGAGRGRAQRGLPAGGAGGRILRDLP